MVIALLKFIDRRIFPIILLLLYPFKSKTKSNSKKILYIRLWGIGEAVCALPTIKKLNEKGYKVDVLTTERLARTFNGQNFIRNIIIFPYTNPFSFLKTISNLRKNDYEIVIDNEQFMNITTIITVLVKKRISIGYNHKFRKNFYDLKINYDELDHFVPNFAKQIEPIGIKFNPTKLIPLSYDKKAKIKVDKILKNLKGKKIIALNIGSGPSAFGRRWPKEKFLMLANKLTEENKNYFVIFTGASEEQKIYNEIRDELNNNNQLSLINKLNLDEFFYLLTKVHVMISSDTGAMHMAPTMGAKTIGIFGLTDPKKSGPFPLDNNICLWRNPNDNPVINVRHGIQPNDKFSTIDLITVEDVYKAVKKLK